ncbi:MAG: hypothetical protein ABI901_05060, partial [Roseiflexaceae bacterium]
MMAHEVIHQRNSLLLVQSSVSQLSIRSAGLLPARSFSPLHSNNSRQHIKACPQPYSIRAILASSSSFCVVGILSRARSLAIPSSLLDQTLVSALSALLGQYWSVYPVRLRWCWLVWPGARRSAMGNYYCQSDDVQAFLGFPYVNTVYWTLTVELLFYLLYTALIAMGRRDQEVPITVLLLLVTNVVEVVAPNLDGLHYLRSLSLIFLGSVFA